MKLPHSKLIESRENLILSAVCGKRVLHIGCTDSPFTSERIANKTLLHMKLMDKCSSVTGIDISAEGIGTMKNTGFSDIHNMDLFKINEEKILRAHTYDYIILSEVIEHVINPGKALETVHEYCQKNGQKTVLIVTAPNINSYTKRLTDFLRNDETVHPDHYYYFSYKTLFKLISDSGFAVTKFQYATYGLKPIYKSAATALNCISSSFLPCLFFEATPRFFIKG